METDALGLYQWAEMSWILLAGFLSGLGLGRIITLINQAHARWGSRLNKTKHLGENHD